MKIYLCGPINGCTDNQAQTWRDWFKRAGGTSPFLSFEWIDPMKRDYRGTEFENYREIVELDKRDVESCDAVIVLYSSPSVGTSMEMLWAWLCHKPIVLINTSEDHHISPWLVYHATAIVKTNEEALAKLRSWLL